MATEADGLNGLAQFAADLDVRALPAAMKEKAHACLLNGLAVAIASAAAEAPRMACAAMDAENGEPAGRARRLYDGKGCASAVAAFANAVLFHTRVQEDAHLAGHLGVTVIPAALAAAEHVGAGGGELASALIAGYEVALRIGRDHVIELNKAGFRSTSVYGSLGAAAAAGRLFGLPGHAMRHAIALAANTACGLREFASAGTPEYAAHAGFASRNGITSALLAANGFTAAPSSLTGPNGFFRAFGGPSGHFAERLLCGLGSVFEMSGITYKPYPACQLHRPVIRGVLALRSESKGRQLDSLRIFMKPYEAEFHGVNYGGPFEGYAQTFMSARFCAALAWQDGMVSFAGMQRFSDSAILELIRRIEVIPDPGRASLCPKLEAGMSDGSTALWEGKEGARDYLLDWPAALAVSQALCREVGVSEATRMALQDSMEPRARTLAVDEVMKLACRATGEARRARRA